jgi:hypothetical protein
MYPTMEITIWGKRGMLTQGPADEVRQATVYYSA